MKMRPRAVADSTAVDLAADFAVADLAADFAEADLVGGYRGAALGGFRGGYVGRGYWGGGRYLGGARLAYGGRYRAAPVWVTEAVISADPGLPTEVVIGAVVVTGPIAATATLFPWPQAWHLQRLVPITARTARHACSGTVGGG